MKRFRTYASGIAGILALAAPGATAVAQTCDGTVKLDYICGSSHKIEQLIGDYDFECAAQGILLPTTSQTVTNFDILATGAAYSFEHNGLLMFVCGDTFACKPYWDIHLPFGCNGADLDYRAQDPVAWSDATDPDKGIKLTFLKQPGGKPLFVSPTPLDGQPIDMGGNDIPNAGISLDGTIYFVVSTGSTSDGNSTEQHAADFSILVRFDQDAGTFTTLRKISALNPNLDAFDPRQGHFILTSLHELPAGHGTQEPGILTFGAGEYRQSNIYLSLTPKSQFETGNGTRYFAGLNNGGQPTWSHKESDAAPIVVDDPNHDGAAPTVGKMSVIYSPDLDLWLMTFDGGRQTDPTTGIYFSYAKQPWGPWSRPQLIFNSCRDGGFGHFIHYHFKPKDGSDCPDIAQDAGPVGPTIGWNPDANPPNLTNDPTTTRGAVAAAQMIERFTRIRGDVLSIDYTMGTWNPYTVVRMRSEFKITR